LEAEYNYKASSVMNVVFLIVGLIVIAAELPIGWIFANLWISMLVSRAYYYFAFGRKKAKVDIFGDEINIVWP
jgi:hypothetical protein